MAHRLDSLPTRLRGVGVWSERGVWSDGQGGARPPPPPEMATATVGTHPTEMHSCFNYYHTDHCFNDHRYIFLEYQNPSDAAEAVAATNGYKLDKAHTFIVNLFSDFEK